MVNFMFKNAGQVSLFILIGIVMLFVFGLIIF